MIKIQDVQSTYLMKENDFCDADYIKENWNSMTESERSGWYTTFEDRTRINATDVLHRAFMELEDDGYEDMLTHCWDSLTNEKIKSLQDVLDMICDDESFVVYREAKLIDPRSKMEE